MLEASALMPGSDQRDLNDWPEIPLDSVVVRIGPRAPEFFAKKQAAREGIKWQDSPVPMDPCDAEKGFPETLERR